MATAEIILYDPMHSSYMTSILSVAGSLTLGVTRYHIRTYEASHGIQMDSYTCGVYVLAVFQMLCRSFAVGTFDKKMRQCLRYRYLCIALNTYISNFRSRFISVFTTFQMPTVVSISKFERQNVFARLGWF
ncbi:hypothetical protein GQ600_4942 [Phytophthora cactorum]|nr:hypothetical protein GQ600_4942 [Phytophthora cactorum]